MIRELLQSASHPSEISAMVKMKLSGMASVEVKEPLDELAAHTSDIEFCYAALNKVSRSFATVIRQLPGELRDPVCIFYLVLRGLDSIEDDTALPNHQKLPLLKNFYAKNEETNWSIAGVGDSEDYRALLANYGKVSRSFQRLDKKYQDIIASICRRMGAGMAEFSERPVKTLDDYDLYCHYVAGLVGIGLTELFTVSGIEHHSLNEQIHFSNSMGLFLQKTNIVRDYYEDLTSGRMFWPQEVWRKYTTHFENLCQTPDYPDSLACLNHMVSDALQHAPDCLEYIRQLRDPDVFRFCAIPQVMAIATLAKVYNNPNVFTGMVKIRKGLTAKLMMDVVDFETLKGYFNFFARDIFTNLSAHDPNGDAILENLFQIFKIGNKAKGKVQFQPSLS